MSTEIGTGLPRATVAKDLETLSLMGPRFMGSDADRATVRYLVDRLSAVDGLAVETQEFAYLGWKLRSPSRLRVVAPEARDVESIAYIYCGPTPPGGISGELRSLGEHWVIGDYKWDKLAIVDGGEIAGYVSGRRDGVAIQQPLGEGSRVVPHFGIGTEDARRLHDWLARGERVVVEGTIESELDPAARAENVVARTTRDAPGGRILVSCHLDSMLVCPGANDNASGMASTLALAEHFGPADTGYGLDFVFFNGEEWDLPGSKAFAARAHERGELDDLKLVLNIDGVAYSDEQLQIWAGPEGLEDAVGEVLRGLNWPDAPRTELISPPPMGADHVPLFNLGVPSCMFTGYEMIRYHTSADVFEERLVDNVLHVADMVRELIEALGDRPLRFDTRDGAAPRPGWGSIQAAAFGR